MKEEMNMADRRLCSGGYLGEISALCFVHLPHNFSSSPLLLVGSGSQVLLYDVELGKLLNSFHVFQGIRVHGISHSFLDDATNDGTFKSTVVVFGETRVKLFTLRFELSLGSQNQSKLCAELVLNHILPRFSHWVMDVLLLRDCVSSVYKANDHLAVGLGENSICLWDISRSTVAFRVRCPEKTLLYSMRLWGDDINSLRVASGTIYNEVIVWKLVSQRPSMSHNNPLEDSNHYNCLSDENGLRDRHYKAIYMNRLAGHEGSIFRLSWSPDGSKLLSVSDDRSARLWNIDNGMLDSLSSRAVDSSDSVGLMVFGHSARVWDCYISDSFIVTAGEDCTCRVWGMDGQQLFLIKEHSGRGIWRCTYDPKSSVLITAGFDASVKVHMLHASLSRNTTSGKSMVVESSKERMEVFTLSVPNLTDQLELLNSKSEYVRCLHFTREDTLYVATNNGYLYHVKLSHATDVKWTELVRISEDSPIVCMDILPKDSCKVEEDWIVVGDGRGNATVVSVVDTVCTPIVRLTFTWSAGMERQLLGTYWCKSLGHRYIFTADPRGILKLWNIYGPIQSGSVPITGSFKALLTAEFTSCFGTRVMSLDALFDEQVLVCGDQRGNLTVFSLSGSLLDDIPCTLEAKYSPISSFKGAHGISSVTSISVSATSLNQIEIRSTGGDGCICFFKYDGNWGSLEFTGMKQVKELSLIQSFSSDEDLVSSYAVGFASAEFIVWNLQNEIKVVQVSCGGWRRPHSYYLGDVPESRNCFAFVKDHAIHIHRLWVPDSEKKLIPHVLHMQFHGREIHSLCFISRSLHSKSDENTHLNRFSCIATGCEDGTVRLTRYASDHQNWLTSKLLGEHVGGSAVRSICFVSKIYKFTLDGTCMFSDQHECIVSSKETDTPSLLISVGAKRVLTSWLLQKERLSNNKAIAAGDCIESEIIPQEVSTSISFQWLSTDMPSKFSSTHKTIENAKECSSEGKNVTNGTTCKTRVPRHNELQSKRIPVDKYENDWRYLAVTAFLVKGADCRSTVCFIVVSCSDATLTLRALVLPYRLWFDVAVFVPQTTPVLSLQNIILPISSPFQESIQVGCAYILISGSTDGSITFWDMTESVQRFMERLSEVQPQSYIDSQKRPRTGRGSQGGRWWRTLHNRLAKSDSEGVMGSIDSGNTKSEEDKADSSLEICNVEPFHVLNSVHQSGVNCLHVSSKGGCDSVSSTYCVLSGGDDQALTCLTLDLSLENICDGPVHQSCDKSVKVCVNNEKRHCRTKSLSHDRIISAHSSAIKGVWGDGRWAFSTGLDQRVRCWEIKEEGKLREHTHAIISVTEPETLDARACGRDEYEIAVAGRGMQMLMFSASHDGQNK
ncbi:hypothetical protein ACHQM5_025834 [Ranunculus cassubicifolius]